mgnify:CR=1 FL=1
MLIEFTVRVEVEKDELTEEMYEGFDKILSDMEEVIGKESLTLDDSLWEEV